MHTDDICYYILAITMKESRTLVSNGLTSMMVHGFLDSSEMPMSKYLHLEGINDINHPDSTEAHHQKNE